MKGCYGASRCLAKTGCRTRSLVGGIAFMLVSGAAAANYVVPWYANPAATNMSDIATQRAVLAASPASVVAPMAWETVSADSHLSGATVIAVRMSHLSYFRPRVYVLLGTGNVVVYTLTRDFGSIKWTSVLSAAELAAAADAAEGATASDLLVAADGSFALLKYGETYSALGYEPSRWYLHVLDRDGNPVSDANEAQTIWNSTSSDDPSGSIYITDGKWKLKAYRNATKQLVVGKRGSKDADVGCANVNDYSAEFLDLSRGVARIADFDGQIDAVSDMPIWGNSKGAFADKMRVYIETSKNQVYYNGRGTWDGVEEVVLAGSAAKSYGYLAQFSTKVQRIVIDYPQLVGLTAKGAFSNGGGQATDLADWSFPALTNVSQQSFRTTNGSGTLALPSIVFTADATDEWDSSFYDTKIESLSISAESRALERIGTRTFCKTTKLRRLVLGGKQGGFTLNQDGKPMITEAAALEDVVFTGGHPVFSDPTTKLFDGKSSDSTRCAIVFAHPPTDDQSYGAEWKQFLDGKIISLLSVAERAAFKAANPGRPVPYAVVDKSAFHTAQDQYLAFTGSEGEDVGCRISAEFDADFDDAVTIAGAGELSPGSGVFSEGSPVTLTAVAGSGGTFRRWYGDIGDNDPTAPSITISAAHGLWIYARFTHPWTVTLESANAGTASNGKDVVNVTEVDSANKTLTIGKPTAWGLFATLVDNDDGTVSTNMTAGGVVDLGGGFFVDGEKYDAVKVAYYNAGGALVPPPDSSVTALFTPGTLQSLPASAFWLDVGGVKGTTYGLLVVDEPDMTEKIPGWSFNNNSIPKILFVTPKLSDWTNSNILWGQYMAGTKLDWWDISALENVHPQAFHTRYQKAAAGALANAPLIAARFGGGTPANSARGSLALPGLRGVATDFSTSTSSGSPFMLAAGLESVTLGGATKATTVTNIGARAFAGDISLRGMTIHADASLVVGADVFADQFGRDGNGNMQGAEGRTPETIVFTGEAVSAAAMGNLLAGVAPAEEKPVKVYVDRRFASWREASYIDTDRSSDTDASALAAVGEKVLGVIRAGAPAPYGKALVVHRESPYGPSPGLFIVVR